LPHPGQPLEIHPPAHQTAVFALCEEIELESDSAAVMLRRTAVVIMAEMAPLGFQLPIG
jgi:hypothetical protein